MNDSAGKVILNALKKSKTLVDAEGIRKIAKIKTQSKAPNTIYAWWIKDLKRLRLIVGFKAKKAGAR